MGTAWRGTGWCFVPEVAPPSLALNDLQAQRQCLGDRIERRIARVLEHGQYIMGPEVAELEESLAARTGAAHVVTCSSGTEALLLALLAWEVGPGDAVFVPTFTFTATAEVVALLGATPVFCDVAPDTFNLDPMSLSAGIRAVQSAGRLRPRVVMPVDLFGQPAEYPTLQRIASEHGLQVLSDAAQSFGATLSTTAVGRFGDATATSFFPAKPLGCYGDGGAVFTDDAELASVMRSLRLHGGGSDKYDTVRIGLNARLDTIQAAVLLAKLEVFDKELHDRAEIADRYTAALGERLSTPQLAPGRRSAWAQYTVRTPNRDAVRSSLRETGVPTAIYYPRPLHAQPAFRHLAVVPNDCRVSQELSASVLSLPMHPYLKPSDQDYIIEELLRCVTRSGC